VTDEVAFVGESDPRLTTWHADMLAGRMSIIAFERRRVFGLAEAERLEERDREARRAKRQQKLRGSSP
jgi:hypothetical protein